LAPLVHILDYMSQAHALPTPLISTLILSSHLLVLSFPLKSFCICLLCLTCRFLHLLIFLIQVSITEVYISANRYPVFSPVFFYFLLLCSRYFLSSLFSISFSLCCFLSMIYHVSHTYKVIVCEEACL